jgi:hypothetical protein
MTAVSMPSSFELFHIALFSSAIAFLCGTFLTLVLKRYFRSQCMSGSVLSDGSSLTHISSAALAFGALSIAVNSTILLVKSRSVRGWALAAKICYNWQPTYFCIVSIYRIVLHAIALQQMRSFACSSATSHTLILAASFIWSVEVLVTGLFAICCDLDSQFSPYLRRAVYFTLEFCLVLDAVGSFIWGNVSASQSAVFIGPFRFALDEHVTSATTSQVVISLYFLVVSIRSRSGRAWAYTPLRFELSATNAASEVSLPQVSCETSRGLSSSTASITHASSSAEDVEEMMLDGESDESKAPVELQSENSSLFSRLRLRWLSFQKLQISRCQVFLIPCVVHDTHDGFYERLELARPLFNFYFLRPLHRFSESHTNYYIAAIVFLGVSSFLCETLLTTIEDRGRATFSLNCGVFLLSLGFISSKRNNLDKAAAKHVASSFRFVVLSLFLTGFVLLGFRTSVLGSTSPWQTASGVILCFIFLASAVLDCSPHLPAFSQTCISVRLTASRSRFFDDSDDLISQIIWCIIFGFWTYDQIVSVGTGNRDCFIELGVFPVCSANLYLSIFSNLFLLMAQALVSRILVPGKSIFVNSSVSCISQSLLTTSRAYSQILLLEEKNRRAAVTCLDRGTM